MKREEESNGGRMREREIERERERENKKRKEGRREMSLQWSEVHVHARVCIHVFSQSAGVVPFFAGPHTTPHPVLVPVRACSVLGMNTDWERTPTGLLKSWKREEREGERGRRCGGGRRL